MHQEKMAETTFQTLINRALALLYWDVLSNNKSKAVWLWARDSWWENNSSYTRNLPVHKKISIIINEPTINEIITHSISDLLGIFGHGIRALQSEISTHLPVPLNPELKPLFPFRE
jgi:hypothetical protein